MLEAFAQNLAKPEERTAEQQAVVDYSDRLIAELTEADVIARGTGRPGNVTSSRTTDGRQKRATSAACSAAASRTAC